MTEDCPEGSKWEVCPGGNVGMDEAGKFFKAGDFVGDVRVQFLTGGLD